MASTSSSARRRSGSRPLAALLEGSGIGIGAQTMHWSAQGAYTGETSGAMLDGVASHVILGHSERRQYDGETDEAVARKVASAVEYGLVPDRRRSASGSRSARRRPRRRGDRPPAASRAEPSGRSRRSAAVAIAYEPVWAIGTGMAASPDDAQAAAAQIRDVRPRARSATRRTSVPILYGGSVTADNAAAIFAERDVDGALVGGASLEVDQFAAIVRAAAAAARRRGERRVPAGRPRRPRRLRHRRRPAPQCAHGGGRCRPGTRSSPRGPPAAPGIGRGGRPAGRADGQLGGRAPQPRAPAFPCSRTCRASAARSRTARSRPTAR